MCRRVLGFIAYFIFKGRLLSAGSPLPHRWREAGENRERERERGRTERDREKKVVCSNGHLMLSVSPPSLVDEDSVRERCLTHLTNIKEPVRARSVSLSARARHLTYQFKQGQSQAGRPKTADTSRNPTNLHLCLSQSFCLLKPRLCPAFLVLFFKWLSLSCVAYRAELRKSEIADRDTEKRLFH